MPNTRITKFECEYDLVNNTAMEDVTLTSSTLWNFCNLEDLVDTPTDYKYMTLEHNFNVLDGSLAEFPDSFTTPFMSSTKSDGSGEFTDVYLNAEFTQPQNFYGITFNFEETYPLEINITITNNEGLILTYTFNPNSLYYVAELECIDIVEVQVDFIKGLPDRYLKLAGIVFGRVLYWDETNIQMGNLLLESDPIGDMISINSLNFTVIDDDNSYNLANSSGLHIYFQKRQVAYAYEWVNGTRLFLGKYFLDSFSWDTNLAKLNCVSYIGLLDGVQYNDGTIYDGVAAGDILEDIFSVARITDYTIDEDTAETLVYGTLKPGSCRDALREILFACNSVVRTTHEEGVEVYKLSDMIVSTIQRNDKINTKITKNDYIYGVSVNYNSYELNTDKLDKIVDDKPYLAGENTVFFNGAYNNVTIMADGSAVTPTKLKTYYCVFELSADAQVTITGNKYEETNSTIQVNYPYVEAGETQIIKSFNSSLCNATLAQTRAKQILNYYKYRLTLDINAAAYDISLDGRRWVENPNKHQGSFIAWYTRRNLDLTGGFLDNSKMMGYYYYEYDWYYADTELYGGETIGTI